MALEMKQATDYDVDTMINISNEAFYEDYVTYGEYPGYNRTRESMLQTIHETDAYIFYNGKIPVATVTVRERENACYYIGTLCVIPEYQHKGIGRLALQKVREMYPQAKTFTLKTPADKIRNIEFYERQGYKIVSENMDGHVKIVNFELCVQ